MIFWQEIFEMFNGHSDNPLYPGKETIVHVWKNDNRTNVMQNIIDEGYGLLLSDGWYLDKQNPNPTGYLWADTWIDYFLNEPTENLNISDKQSHLLLGGEICQWGEEADENSIEILIWPRASAAAERLWSPKLLNYTAKGILESPLSRIRYQRCRMSSRGFKSLPVRPDYCPLYVETEPPQTFSSWIILTEIIIFSIVIVILITVTIVLCRKQRNTYSPLSPN